MSHTRKLVHTEVISMRWADMDAQRHMNNAVYFRFMEQARVAWFDRLRVRNAPSGPTLVNASCTFLKQIVYPCDVEVKMFLGEVGRSSFQTYYELRPSYDPDTVYADGAGKVVWVDFENRKSTPVPEVIRKLAAGRGG